MAIAVVSGVGAPLNHFSHGLLERRGGCGARYCASLVICVLSASMKVSIDVSLFMA